MSCSVIKNLRIVDGCIGDYRKLSRFHYRSSRLVAYSSIFALRYGGETAGVIVYTMPFAGVELRRVAVGDIFIGLDRCTQLSVINKNIRCISRVIIEPRFRGLSLAAEMVRQTMTRVNIPIIEGLSVMGHINSFFERAGMSRYEAGQSLQSVRLQQALSSVGIESDNISETDVLHRRIEALRPRQKRFIESEIGNFLDCYGRSRNMSPGRKRTEFVLSKLTARPVYYVWFNPKLEMIM